MAEHPNALELGRRSREAVMAKERDRWLEMFTDDAVVADPIGPSPFDEEGKGHRGKTAIAAFYDNVISQSEHMEFEIERTYLCGDEGAAVGSVRTTLAGGTHIAVVELVMTYKTDGAGKLTALRAYWEFDKTQLIEA